MLLQLKETKLAYRAAFEAFRQQRGEMDALTVEVAAARRALMEGFDAWFAATGANMSSMVRPMPPVALDLLAWVFSDPVLSCWSACAISTSAGREEGTEHA